MKYNISILTFILCVVSGALYADERDHHSEFGNLVAASVKFCNDPSSSERSCYERLDNYFNEIYDMDNAALHAKLDESAIISISLLLDNDNYIIRYRAARILGAIGKKASIVLPKLRMAQANSKPKFGDDGVMESPIAETAITLAIQRIEGGR